MWSVLEYWPWKLWDAKATGTMRAVLRSLVDAGHSVTMFTPIPVGDQNNYLHGSEFVKQFSDTY